MLHGFPRPQSRTGSLDDAGPMERSWLAAQYLVIEEEDCPGLLVLAADDASAPILLLPAYWPADKRDCAFGWARAELAEQRVGWLESLRWLLSLGKVAAISTLASAVFDANRNGIPDTIGHLCHLCRHLWPG